MREGGKHPRTSSAHQNVSRFYEFRTDFTIFAPLCPQLRQAVQMLKWHGEKGTEGLMTGLHGQKFRQKAVEHAVSVFYQLIYFELLRRGRANSLLSAAILLQGA